MPFRFNATDCIVIGSVNKFDLAKQLGVAELDKYQASLDKLLGQALTSTVADINKPLYELTNAKSKRLRSSLVFAVAKSQNQKITDDILNGAAAVELLHLASLVHDDIIDKADIRWGKPTIAKKYGRDTAIIIGDLVFARALELAASVNQAAAQVLAKAFALMCEGQQLEITFINDLNKTPDVHLKIIEHKTAELFKASCQIGAMCAGLSVSQVKNFANFGKHFGFVFQLTDDLLDIIGNPKQLGKPVGQDINLGIYTTTVTFALKTPLSDEVKTIIKSKDNPSLAKFLTETGFVYKTNQLINNYSKQAQKSLDKIHGNDTMQKLAALPGQYYESAVGKSLKY